MIGGMSGRGGRGERGMGVETPADIITRIEPVKGLRALDWQGLLARRELLYFFVWRDLKVRYKQTALGFFWVLIAPLLTMVVFTVIFGRVAQLSTDGLPEPVYYLAGLCIWRYFAASLTKASESLVAQQAILTKTYFPRLIVPLAGCIAPLVDFAVVLAVLAGLMFAMGVPAASTIVLTPLLVAVAMLAALGTGLLLAALNVRYRDVTHTVPFFLQLWMFCTIIVPFSYLPLEWGAWRYLYGLNPMAGPVEAFRWTLSHPYMDAGAGPVLALLAMGLPVSLALMAAGLAAFARMERTFADVV